MRTFLVVADDAAAAATACEVLEASDVRVAAVVPLEAAVARLDSQALLDGMILELSGLANEAVEAHLPALAAAAGQRAVPIVAVVDAGVLDAAWALLDTRATILTDPGPFDRTIAVAAIGPAPIGAFREANRLDDDRIRQLTAEVTRFAERLRQLSEGVEARGAEFNEPVRVFRGSPMVGAAVDPGQVRGMIRARRLRATVLPAELFADPAWDMLLDLYAAELEHRRVSVSSLCIAAAVPGTTALRWIGTMIDAGLFERRADPLDKRRAYIHLSDSARGGMEQYFAAMRASGLTFG